MEALFLKLFNMSITASWLVLAVVILRLLLKKAPKAVTVFLWALVGIRLICPFSFESVLSLIPSAETVPEAMLAGSDFNIDTGLSAVDSRINGYLDDRYIEGVTVPAGNGMTVMGFISVIWLVGIAVMLIYTLISYLKIHRKVREAVPYNENIWVCDRISAPFILGVFRPRIYLPSDIDKQDEEYVIAHERAHLKRRDHLIKPLGFLLLTVYWFNPVMWIAYILLCRDIELACDEKVIKTMGIEIKKPYSEALINCSLPRRSIAACPLAFGEVGVKSRIKSVLNYKKPAFWVVIVALALCVILPIVFLTNPISATAKNIINENNYTIISQERSDITLSVPKSLIKESAYTEKGQKFKKNEVPAYKTNTTTIYLEKIMLSNSNENELFLMFNCSYGSIDENNSILLPYTKIKDGIESCVGLNSGDSAKDSASICSSGPDEQFGLSVAKETIENFPEDIKIYAFLNKLTYVKKGEASPDSLGISGSMISAECENIEYEYLFGTVKGDYPHISVRWTNKTDDILCFGDEFTLYKNGTIYEPKEAIGFHAILHIVDSGESMEQDYVLSSYDLESGNYRLEKQFYLKSNPDKKYRAFIEFSVDKAYSFLGKQYIGEKIVFENGLYSFVLSDNDIPQFLISDEDFSLLTTDYPEATFSSSWYKIDGLQKIELKSSNFDDLFEPAVWKHGYSAKSLRKNNLNAFSAFDLSGRMYYLLEQKNGDIFIAQGYTETQSFRWVYKMKEAVESSDDGKDNETDSSSSQIGGYNPYFNATVLEVYKNSVLVEPFEGSNELKSADKITINTNVISTHPVPELKEGMQIRIVYNGTIEETYPANIPTAFAIYELREVDGKLEPVIATPPKSEAATSLIDSDIKEIYVLSRPSKGQIEKFTVSKTYTDNKLKQLKAFLTTEYCEEKEADNWVKFNPAHPNQTKLALVLSDGTTMIINIHFTESAPYYIAIGTVEESFDTEKDYSDIEYTRYIAKAVFGEFLKSII